MACATLKRHLDCESTFMPTKRARCSSVLLPSASVAVTTMSSPYLACNRSDFEYSSTGCAAQNVLLTSRSMSMSPSPPPTSSPLAASSTHPQHRTDFVMSKSIQEKLAARILDELRRSRRNEKPQHHFGNSNFDGNMHNIGSDDLNLDFNLHPDKPVFTFRHMNLICRKVFRDFEKELREEYDRVLSEKMHEQYAAFVKFSQDQIRKNCDATTPSFKYLTMAGQKFQYDESGGTFYYFLLAFTALILIPGTFFYWPKRKKIDLNNKDNCYCAPCVKKILLLNTTKPWVNFKNIFIKISIICGWIFIAFILFKISKLDYEMVNFDPYEILGVSIGATQAEIKKAYRRLSVVLHPDKGTGDEKAFMKITKAYQALTDDEARKNWETYGNPDGPSAMSFGIALPAWIVEKQNSVWVLGLYVLVIMIALPTTVGLWWYNSMKFSSDRILLETIRMYCSFFAKAPGTSLKKVLMILAGSLEFSHHFNSEIVQRVSDEKEVLSLIKKFDSFNEKTRENPLYLPYSIKARAIIFAHLDRILLNPNTLEKDRQYIIEKCPYLIQEMVNCVNYLISMAYSRRIPILPCIETMENVMKVNPLIVQAVWDAKSPFLQLPHVEEDHLKNFKFNRRQIRSLGQLARMPDNERRLMLNKFSDIEYGNIVRVLSRMPYIEFDAFFEVIDDEKPNVITVGALITVTVRLKRTDMRTLFVSDSDPATNIDSQIAAEEETKNHIGNNVVNRKISRKQYKKNKKNKRNKGSRNKNKGKKSDSEHDSDEDTDENSKTKPKDNQSSDESSAEENHVTKTHNDDDDNEWEKIQQKISKREKCLEGRSKISHTVHCPYFPVVKQEYWWVYVCDRKSRTLLTPPYYVTNLIEEEECQLRFSAPNWAGKYVFTVCLRSDSYVGIDQQLDIEVDVKQAAAVPVDHPQWSFEDSENEDQADSAAQESEYTTDEDIADN